MVIRNSMSQEEFCLHNHSYVDRKPKNARTLPRLHFLFSRTLQLYSDLYNVAVPFDVTHDE
jgi:hypothetical protein